MPAERPLSPHLQIYKFQWPAILSIAHRFSGVGLSLGSVFLVYWLWALAMGSVNYGNAIKFLSFKPIKFCLFLCSVAFFYHLANGIRHLAWDLGWGFSLKTALQSGIVVIIATLLLTLWAWF